MPILTHFRERPRDIYAQVDLEDGLEPLVMTFSTWEQARLVRSGTRGQYIAHIRGLIRDEVTAEQGRRATPPDRIGGTPLPGEGGPP